MEKNKVLVLAGTLAVSGAMLLHGDVVKAANTTGSATVATTAASNLQNGSYTATANLYRSGTMDASMMSRMVNQSADVIIKNQNATIKLTFGEAANADMVTSWTIDGVKAVKDGQIFSVTVPVADLNKTLQSSIRIDTVFAGAPFSETQPVDVKITDLTFVARDPEEVAAEKAAADKAAADKAAADKAAADKAAADKAAADKAAADKAAADKAAADKAAADKAAADKAAADKVIAGTKLYRATANLYKSGTIIDSSMRNMVKTYAYVTIADQKATIQLTFVSSYYSDMVTSWTINGVKAVQNGQTFSVTVPVVDLNKTLHAIISVSTVFGGRQFSEIQPVDLKLSDFKLIKSLPATNNEDNLPNNYVSPNQTIGNDVPLTAQLSSSSKLPNTATNETTTAPLVAALVSAVLALGIWFKKVLR